MKIEINGFTNEVSKSEQAQIFKEWLPKFYLPVSNAVGDEKTGKIVLEVPNYLEINKITQAFASFAESLAMSAQRDIEFEVYLPKFGFNFTAAGSI